VKLLDFRKNSLVKEMQLAKTDLRI